MVQYPAVSFGTFVWTSPPKLYFWTLKAWLFSLWGSGHLHSAPQAFVDTMLITLVIRAGSIGQAANVETVLQPQQWDFNKSDVESIHMPWSVVWVFWVVCDGMRSSGITVEDGDRWRYLNMVWPHPCCSLVSTNPRMNPDLKRWTGRVQRRMQCVCQGLNLQAYTLTLFNLTGYGYALSLQCSFCLSLVVTMILLLS